jgi:hypothetical protein
MSIDILDEKEVQIQTSLEPFYPSAINKLAQSKFLNK